MKLKLNYLVEFISMTVKVMIILVLTVTLEKLPI